MQSSTKCAFLKYNTDDLELQFVFRYSDYNTCSGDNIVHYHDLIKLKSPACPLNVIYFQDNQHDYIFIHANINKLNTHRELTGAWRGRSCINTPDFTEHKLLKDYTILHHVHERAYQDQHYIKFA
jgi:hypothetical protein